MGGKGSGRPNESVHKGRPKTAAMAVVGSGVPIRPNAPADVLECWDLFADVVSGVAFEQDSEAITDAAWLLWRQRKFREALHADPLNDDLNKRSLAVGRALWITFGQFGMTPRSRQVLLVPREDEGEKDEFEQMLGGQ